MYNDSGSRGLNSYSFGTTLSINTWYDIGYTWNNTTNALKLYVDGVLAGTGTSTRNFSASFSNQLIPQLGLGVGGQSLNTEQFVDEDVMWDEIIDFTSSSFALSSGTGSLNGASRTKYLDYTPIIHCQDPGIANVRDSQAYYIDAVLKTGTADIPSADDVRSGTAVDATTGNLTLPAVGDVRTGDTFGTSGTEFTGTMDLPSEDDVRSATTFDNTLQTGNMTLPPVGDVIETIQYGTSGTELTGTFGVPAEGEVQDTIGFGEDDTEFTGSLTVPALPADTDVRDSIVYGYTGSELTGNITLPAVNNVILGVTYGANGVEFTGTSSTSGQIPGFSGKFDFETAVSQIELFMKANLNTYIAQMNTERSDLTLADVVDASYVFQSLSETEMPYDPFLFYGEVNTETTGNGPTQDKAYTMQFTIILANSNEQAGIMGKRLLRYREILEKLFEEGWNKINKRLKIEVSGISPFPFSTTLNTNNTHMGIGVTIDFNIA